MGVLSRYRQKKEWKSIETLFGATSSPGVATFCPRKTAQLNQEWFDAKVEATVKRNMYVDDMMKSASAT